MLRELWQKHRTAFCFAFGMLCFLCAGLLVRSLPGVREKLMQAGHLPAPNSNRTSTETRPGSGSRSAAETPLPADSVPGGKVARQAGAADSVLAVPPEDGGGERPEQEWFLYITGSVRRPGVYRLPVGSRLFQLVEAAGGLNNFADPVAINMAALLADGMHVNVPRKGERPRENSEILVGAEVIVPAAGLRADVIDINRATAEEFTALKGIGPALAKNIVEYRRLNGRFQNVEDLLQVKGIGEKKLEGFRKFLIVGP